MHGSWRTLAACMAYPAITTALYSTCFGLWAKAWIDEFHAPSGVVMAGFAAGQIVLSLTSPFVGRVLERSPARLAAVLGALLLGGGYMLASFATAAWQVIGVYATLMAIACAFAGRLPAQIVAIRLLPNSAGMVAGLLACSVSVGAVFVPLAFAVIISDFGWRAAFQVSGALVVAVVAPIIWLGLPGRLTAASSLAPKVAKTGPSLRETLRLRGFWLPVIAVIPVTFSINGILTNIVAIGADSDIGTQLAGVLIAVLAGGSALGALGLGWLADRWNPRILFAAMLAAMSGSVIAIAIAPSFPAIACGMAVLGVGGGGAGPLMNVMLVQSFGAEAFGRVVSLVTSTLMIGFSGPVVLGVLRDVTGSYQVGLIVCAAVMSFAAVSLLVLGQRASLRGSTA